MSPTFHNGPIPFGSFVFDIHTSKAPSPTLSTILEWGIGMVGNNQTFLTPPPFPLIPTLSIGPGTSATNAWSTKYMYWQSSIGFLTVRDGGEAGRHLLCICTFPSFPLYSTDAGTFGIPPPNDYTLYNRPTSGFVKGEGHNTTGWYDLPLPPLLITTFPPHLHPHKSWGGFIMII